MKSRPKVLLAFAISPNKIGGMEIFGAELATQLNQKGMDLVMCFQEAPPPLVRDFLLKPGNVSLDILQHQEAHGTAAIRDYIHLLRRHRPCIVLYSLGGAVRWWPLLGMIFGVRRTVYFDQTSRSAAAMTYRAPALIRLMMKPLYASGCATDFIKACSDREGIVPPHKSRRIYSAIDLSKFHGQGNEFRTRYAIPEERIIVLQISWLVADKGIGLALEAASHALAVRSDLHFVFCGDGEGRPAYEEMAVQLGIKDHVTWTGQLRDISGSGALDAADIQIQCSQWNEAFCYAVAEGMSAHLPVIASRIGGLPELVEDGVSGLLFDPKSCAELTAAILRFAADEPLRIRMGQRGLERVRMQHNLKDSVAQWTDLLMSGFTWNVLR